MAPRTTPLIIAQSPYPDDTIIPPRRITLRFFVGFQYPLNKHSSQHGVLSDQWRLAEDS